MRHRRWFTALVFLSVAALLVPAGAPPAALAQEEDVDASHGGPGHDRGRGRGHDKHPGEQDDEHRGSRRAEPFVFVGSANECGGTPGSNIVTSAWLRGMGLPDNGINLNTAPGARRDAHYGLLLNKNGPTADCSSSGAVIKGIRSGSPITELGFDFRNGSHCGAGAPRFNVTTTAGHTYFLGCSHGAQSAAPQDPAQWTRVRFSATQGTVSPQLPSNPPFVFGTTPVRRVIIIFDEGTDVASPQDPAGVGLAVLDNIDVNGRLITRGSGIRPGGHGD